MIVMTRRVEFSAAYEVKRPTGGPAFYGHNYLLEVGVQGEISPQTGILVNIKEIDRIVRQQGIAPLEGRLLNRQFLALCERHGPLENLAMLLAERLAPVLPSETELAFLRLEQSATRYAVWQRQERDRPKERGTVILLTRVYEFAASHRLHSPHLSEEENRALFGKCNYANGHGHNYLLEVTVAGPVEARSGRVMDTDLLDTVVHREVVDRYDHRHLNYDIPEFADTIPSAEIITTTIWERLADHIPAPARLHRVRLYETERNIFDYYGPD